ncbi:MAG TPA: arginine deiminase-related protein [Gemmatimonadaceae bacterium]|nr:arginine deiminase-related protein [Gemmatimonadaceae bacterium]
MAATVNQTLAPPAPSPQALVEDFAETLSGGKEAVETAQLENTTPSTLERPAYLMNCPFSYSAEEPNNVWMCELDETDRRVDRSTAMRQFAQLYDYMASDAFVFLLPTPANCQLQDLVFTANLGIVLEHVPERNVVVLSNFTSAPRVGETEVGHEFFRAMGYTTVVAPHKFEGEAELKHLHDNVYIGGYGIRSDREAYEWMEAEFGMEVIAVRETDEYCYHLDCSIFPITADDTLVCTKLFDPQEVASIEKATNIIDVSEAACYAGICNSVRHHQTLLNSSHIHSLRAGTDEYFEELKKNRELEDIAVRLGLEVNYFNLSEYHKGGALLSCMVMHLNRRSYSFSLL